MLITLKDIINEKEKEDNILLSVDDKKDLEIKLDKKRKTIKMKDILIEI